MQVLIELGESCTLGSSPKIKIYSMTITNTTEKYTGTNPLPAGIHSISGSADKTVVL